MLADVGDDVGQVDGLAVALDAAVVFVAGHGQAIAVQNDIELALFGGKCSVHDKLHGMVIGFPREGLDGKLKFLVIAAGRLSAHPYSTSGGKLPLGLANGHILGFLKNRLPQSYCQILLMAHLPFKAIGLWSFGDATSTRPTDSFTLTLR